MNVTELINYVSLFVFGRSDPTEDDRVMYLNYLNLADNQIFPCVKNSRRLQQDIDLFFEPDLNYAALPKNYIAEIWSGRNKLEYAELFYNLDSISNRGYYFLNNNIYVNKQNLASKTDPSDGVTKAYVKLIVSPLRKQLVESVAQPQPIVPIETDTPVYPESYHLGLVHGAVYFLFLSNKGFTEKIKYAERDWEKSKSDLTAYYQQDK